MTNRVIRDREHVERLYALRRGEKYVYYNSGNPGRSSWLFSTVRKMFDQGRIGMHQKKIEDGTINYVAIGKLSKTEKILMDVRSQRK